MSILSKFKTIHRDVRYLSYVKTQMAASEVNKILRKNEISRDVSGGSVKSFDTNNMPSNTPMEDYHTEAECLLSSGHMFGIFDGHGGEACSRVVSERLFKYVAAALLPLDVLNNYIVNGDRKELLKTYNLEPSTSRQLQSIYDNSFESYLRNLRREKRSSDFNVEKSLERAFEQLDLDMSTEALDNRSNMELYKEVVSVAKSGTVACMAHINGPHLHIANVGDCGAVLGSMTENGNFQYEKLMIEHNFENELEVQRILNEHPPNERHTIFKMERLLGNLAPLRSLGDFKYKWSKKDISDVLTPYLGYPSVPFDYHTPPYLSGKPQVFYHCIRPKDKFLVIASDGLWDIMTPMEVINVVGQHMLGKVYFDPFQLPEGELTLGQINNSLEERRKGLMTKPADENAATHLLRHALGGSEYGLIQEERLTFMLSLNPILSRSIRDDITITVIYFDSEYISNI